MKISKIIKRITDVALTAALLLLMAFQVTGQFAHEWIGIAMVALTILHQILNRRFYSAIFKGKYNPLRAFQLIVNILLLLSFLCTAACGMMISRFATPFMHGVLSASIVRQGHLALSHWSFVLMGIHLGMHFGIVASKLPKGAVKTAAGAVMSGISVYGFYPFFKANFLDYMLLKIPFAFLDYTKAWLLVIVENLAMLLAWAFAGFLVSLFLKAVVKKGKSKTALLYLALLIAIIIAAVILSLVI